MDWAANLGLREHFHGEFPATYAEVLEAIEADEPRAMEEELGDLLFQVVFHAQLARELGQFTASRDWPFGAALSRRAWERGRG